MSSALAATKAAISLGATPTIKFGQLKRMMLPPPLLLLLVSLMALLVEMRPLNGAINGEPFVFGGGGASPAFGGMIQQQQQQQPPPPLLRLNRQTVGAELKQQQQPKKQKNFESDCLRAHNKWRRLHQAPELVFDKKIAAFAQKRANFIASSDGVEFRHPPDLPFGENLAWHSRPSKSCAELIKMWYDEVDLYDFKRAAFSHETGHFTQLVWRETKHVGCASATSTGPRGGIYLVCNYDPPGNFLGEGQQNVLRRAATVSQDTPVPTTTTTVAPPATTTAQQTIGNAATSGLVGSSTSRSLDTTTTTTTVAPLAPVGAGAGESPITTKKPAGNGRRKNKKKKGNKKKNKNKNKKKGNKKNKNKRRNNSSSSSSSNNNNNKKLKLEEAAAAPTVATSTSIPIVTTTGGSTAIPLLAVVAQ